MSFLNAEWRKLVLFNYEIDPILLRPYLPAKTEIDLYNGKCFVSLVGFKFIDTKMLGIKFPFHVNFEEVNLRFYVRHKAAEGWRRGVVFIKEIVPKRAISTVANAIYKEHYETCKMQHNWEIDSNTISISYAWKKRGKWQEIAVEAENNPQKLDLKSEEAFITEHYWGYTKINLEKSFEYKVTHPVWDVYPVKKHRVDIDFGLVYGDTFRFLNAQDPVSVMLAEGSEITVEKAEKI